MHPVSRLPRGRGQTSLAATAATGTSMKCSDCHTNDDSDGPQGPHGSNYPFLLSGNYDTEVYTDESPMAFQFCYSCHDRRSILDNRSFPLHRQHIAGDMLKGTRGTSCYTCHVSHGSRNHRYLIEFNPEAVSPDRMGQVEYRYKGARTGECYLTCHGYEHSPSEY